MSATNENWNRKIRSADLKQFMASDRADRITVLIEVEAPEPQVEFAHPPHSEQIKSHPLTVHTVGEQVQDEQDAIDETRSTLDALQVEHHFLRGARVFVADTTPEQLRQITQSPSVRAIIPNHMQKLSLPGTYR